jgi:hypothetical protein
MWGGASHVNSGSVVVFTDGTISPTFLPPRCGLVRIDSMPDSFLTQVAAFVGMAHSCRGRARTACQVHLEQLADTDLAVALMNGVAKEIGAGAIQGRFAQSVQHRTALGLKESRKYHEVHAPSAYMVADTRQPPMSACPRLVRGVGIARSQEYRLAAMTSRISSLESRTISSFMCPRILSRAAA